MDTRELHRRVLGRIALAWLVLSALLGTAALYVEMRKSDALMLDLATARAREFVDHIAAADPAARANCPPTRSRARLRPACPRITHA